MKLKQIIPALVAGLAMCLGLCGCVSKGDLSDWAYIEDKGTLVVGITYNMPMNYNDDSGKLTGFETDFTTEVCKKLGVEPKFQLIEWSKKEMELKSKTIDLIWNGLTVTEDRKKEMLFTTSYLRNKQVTIVKAENASKYPDTQSMAGITIAFESGSAGEDIVKDDAALKDCKTVNCEAQVNALMEVKAGTADACIVDYTLGRALTREGSDYSDLVVLENITDSDEEYAIGARLEDTETVNKINEVIAELAADGTLKEIADKYELAEALLV